MQKVYLLLRNNRQTGPFGLDELLQFDLKPFDLIWIEGKSAGWYYPQEIEALRPHLPFLQAPPAQQPPAPTPEPKSVASTQARKVFVAMPVTPPSAQSVQPPTPTPPPASAAAAEEPAALKTTYTRSLTDVETEYTNWTYRQKTQKPKRRPVKALAVAALLVGVAVAAWQWWPSGTAQPTPALTETGLLPSAVAEPAPDSAAAPLRQPQNASAAVAKKTTTVSPKQPSTKPPVVRSQPEKTTRPSAPPVTTVADNPPPAPPTTNDAVTNDAAAENAEPTTQAPQKKKLREKIADLFRKKGDEKVEEARPAEETDGHRQSTRRESGSSLAQLVTVRFAVPNDWMMGIKGAKATLLNRSSETLARAVVEVVYYNEDNDVLDRRTISFSTIKPKASQTVALPDHATATRLEHRVVSAVGADPVARL